MSVRLLVLCGLLCGLCFPAPVRAQSLAPEAMAAQVVNRLSFGAVPGEVDRVRAMGVAAYVEEQLAPEKLPEPQALAERLAALKTVSMDTVQLFRTYGPKAPGGPRKNPTMDEITAAREKASIIHTEASEAKLWRILLSPRQLEELMCDFWYNHFNVPASKGLAHLWVGSYERESIRPHALGRFEDLLLAVTHHPAMLINLENWQSASPDSPQGKGKPRPLVEVHARELMTAHTMGVDAKIKNQDVNSLALILAGWSIGAPRTPQDKLGFVFDEQRHDIKDKVFLGKTIKASGVNEGVEALRLLAAQPETAHNICAKLIRFFLTEDVPKPLEESLSKVFLDSKGDIKAVLRALFSSPEFADRKYAGTKFKNPLRFVAAVVRASGRPVQEVRSLAENLDWLGMPLYDAPGSSGFKDSRDVWLAAELMLRRLNLAWQAGEGRMPCWSPGSFRPVEALDAMALARTMGLTLSPATSHAVEGAAPGLKAGVLLGSPEGQQF